ncbi:hypothetical protein [Marmoricola sp. RAF53]|uniref:hypothetical protein n=1 Tax=Marmoricola sp. RAF53 TaxID=3233059 RepID=UPI003F9A620E
MSAEVRPRPRHLIDPAALGRPRPDLAAEKARLERVQRWVMSTLTVTTVLHLSAGLLLAAVLMDADRGSARYGLVAIAGVLGVGSVAAGLAIHRRPLRSPWLLLGMLPVAVGIVLLAR